MMGVGCHGDTFPCIPAEIAIFCQIFWRNVAQNQICYNFPTVCSVWMSVGCLVGPSHFLVADTQLYKGRCPSICLSVCPSVDPLGREHESKSGKTSVLDAFVNVYREWGLDGDWTPLPTCLQLYCDPASPVLFFCCAWPHCFSSNALVNSNTALA